MSIANYTTGKRSPVRAPMKQGFYCKHALNVTLKGVDENKSTVDTVLQFKAGMRLRAYDVSKIDGYGNSKQEPIPCISQLLKTEVGNTYAFLPFCESLQTRLENWFERS